MVKNRKNRILLKLRTFRNFKTKFKNIWTKILLFPEFWAALPLENKVLPLGVPLSHRTHVQYIFVKQWLMSSCVSTQLLAHVVVVGCKAGKLHGSSLCFR